MSRCTRSLFICESVLVGVVLRCFQLGSDDAALFARQLGGVDAVVGGGSVRVDMGEPAGHHPRPTDLADRMLRETPWRRATE